MLQTEFEFTLPKGFVDKDGNLHRAGMMRLANAKDEILPLQDPRVQRNEAYHIVILLSRVITRLGEVRDVNPAVVENLFASDLSYLQSFYNQINSNGKAMHPAICPSCNARFEVEMNGTGES
ncbi:MAG: phage tail assembly protein [Acidobacteria bacterium]|nr:phage tail assembly protein [Acidobacteriota bacterium]